MMDWFFAGFLFGVVATFGTLVYMSFRQAVREKVEAQKRRVEEAGE